MRADDLARLVWINLGRMKTRVAMTALGVVIGTAAILVLISLAAGLQRNAASSFENIGSLTEITVYSGSYMATFIGREPPKLDTATLDRIRQIEGVVAVTPLDIASGGALKLNRLVGSASVMGIEARVIPALDWQAARGHLRISHGQAIAGASVAQSFFDPLSGPVNKPPDLVGQTLKLELTRLDEQGQNAKRAINIRIVGVLKQTSPQYDNALLLPLADIEEINTWVMGQRTNPSRTGYPQALVKVTDADRAVLVDRQIQQEGFYTFSPRTILQSINQLFLIIQAVMGGIGAIALLVAAIGIANTMTMAIYERTREIGVMKAVGASNRDVMSVFLAEAASIGLLGGIGGVLVGFGIGQLIGLIAAGMLATQAAQAGAGVSQADITIIYTPPWLMLFALAFSALIGIISGIYPALRAANLSPLTAIKYE